MPSRQRLSWMLLAGTSLFLLAGCKLQGQVMGPEALGRMIRESKQPIRDAASQARDAVEVGKKGWETAKQTAQGMEQSLLEAQKRFDELQAALKKMKEGSEELRAVVSGAKAK